MVTTTGYTDRLESVLVGDVLVGDRIEVGGFPETVQSVRRLGEGLILVRTEASVILRQHAERLELLREVR